jgi:uncharacterized membrane protein
VSLLARRKPDEANAQDSPADSGYPADATGAGGSFELQRHWSGPLPPAAELRQYEEILPGSAKKILKMAVKSVTGHIVIADKLTTAEIKAAKRGQDRALALTLIAFIASIVFFSLGNAVAGVAFISVPVVMLIRSFITRS